MMAVFESTISAERTFLHPSEFIINKPFVFAAGTKKAGVLFSSYVPIDYWNYTEGEGKIVLKELDAAEFGMYRLRSVLKTITLPTITAPQRSILPTITAQKTIISSPRMVFIPPSRQIFSPIVPNYHDAILRAAKGGNIEAVRAILNQVTITPK